MAKMVFATRARQVIIDAPVQLWGGLGWCRPVVESLYREIRALRIYEGRDRGAATHHRRDLLSDVTTESWRPCRHLRRTCRRDQQARRFCSTARAVLPGQLNCATELLDRWVGAAAATARAHPGAGVRWSYAELRRRRIASPACWSRPGPRARATAMLLRQQFADAGGACWFAVVRAGGIAVGSMPLLRQELRRSSPRPRSRMRCAMRASPRNCTGAPPCPDADESAALPRTRQARTDRCPRRRHFGHVREREDLEGRHLHHRLHLRHHRPAQGHDALPPRRDGRLRHLARATCCVPHDDVFIGSPPLAFTFGLGGLLVPAPVGASTVLLEKPRPMCCSAAIAQFRATILFTAPTSYRAMAGRSRPRSVVAEEMRQRRRGRCPATRALGRTSGIEMIDRHRLHRTAAHLHLARRGACGRAPPARRAGLLACVLDDEGRELPRGQVGHLAVKGPTGCRLRADERQQLRAQRLEPHRRRLPDRRRRLLRLPGAQIDDMIVSGGWQIAGPGWRRAAAAPKVASAA